MSRSANLYRLQNIDSQIQKIHARIDDIEAILKDTSKLKKAEERVSSSKETLHEIQKQLRLAENKVNDQQYKIEETDKALYGGRVRNPKELQDLQNEAAALRRYLAVLEDKQLETMIKLEEAEASQYSAVEILMDIQQKTKKQHEELSNELSELRDTLNRLQVERNAVIQTIDEDDLATYEKLLGSRRGLAVARIMEQTCGACGTTLSPAVIQSAQSHSQIVQCHSCRRIIYPG